MKPDISVIIPAYNEAAQIASTLKSLRKVTVIDEIIVVDDGSEDDTAETAVACGYTVICQPQNFGKGFALETGWRRAKGEIIVFLDADLGQTAVLTHSLIQPVLSKQCDMSIAKFPPAEKKGGLGFVKGLARQGVKHLTGHHLDATLSGQRAIRRDILQQMPSLSRDFGIEISLTVETLRLGFRICEVPVRFKHRETTRDWTGYVHRGRQFWHISKAIYKLWRTAS